MTDDIKDFILSVRIISVCRGSLDFKESSIQTNNYVDKKSRLFAKLKKLVIHLALFPDLFPDMSMMFFLW